MEGYRVRIPEVDVCSHTRKFINMLRIELGLTEREAVERMLNSYAHDWYTEFEVPLDSSHSAVGAAIRNFHSGGSRER